MADKSKIEWTNATWNPVTGCDKVSAGCKNCYAERDWKRLSANSTSVYYQRAFTDVQMHEERLLAPLKWMKPRLIFVNSMSDLFHDKVSAEFIHEVFLTMAQARVRGHVFQILTKRPERMKEVVSQLNVEDIKGRYDGSPVNMPEFVWPLPNVWLGVSVENQQAANERIPYLLQTPAAIRWISAEPLLGPVDLTDITHKMGVGEHVFDALSCGGHIEDDEEFHGATIHWVVAGGESGPGARITNPDWYRSLRAQCLDANVPFFFKQHGEFIQVSPVDHYKWMDDEGRIHESKDELRDISALGDYFYFRVGKKRAGRTLDGQTYDAMPEVGN